MCEELINICTNQSKKIKTLDDKNHILERNKSWRILCYRQKNMKRKSSRTAEFLVSKTDLNQLSLGQKPLTSHPRDVFVAAHRIRAPASEVAITCRLLVRYKNMEQKVDLNSAAKTIQPTL